MKKVRHSYTKFKSFRSLHIPKKLHESLIWFVRSVEKGIINGGKKTFKMDIIADSKHDYDYNECGTAGCIGGWCAIHALGLRSNRHGVYRNLGRKVHILFERWGGDHIEIWELFHGKGALLSDIDEKVAAATTRHYLETGVVDYGKFVS